VISDATTTVDVHQRLEMALRRQLSRGMPSPGVLSLAFPIEPLDLVDWLSAQPQFPKVYWQARGETKAYAGIGTAILVTANSAKPDPWTALARHTETNPDAVFFGGLRFDPLRPPGAEWTDFGNATFLLPRFLIEQDTGDTILRCNLHVTSDASPETLIANMLSALERLTFDAPHLSGRPAGRATACASPNQSDWIQSITQLTRQISDAHVRKVVLARRMDIAFSETPNPFLFIRHFLQMKSPAYFFCLQFTATSAFVGSSPERLLARTGRTVSSEALAGTRRRGKSLEEDLALKRDLLTSTKERHEHQLVQDHIQTALAPFCDDLESATEPTVLPLILVQHLLQVTTGHLRDDIQDAALVKALHPTPAVGGVPTQAALDLIRSFEAFDRGWYAAPVGIISRDHVDLSVAIRSGLLHGSTLSLYCGAGIVEHSDPLSEWEETETKFANFLHVIHMD